MVSSEIAKKLEKFSFAINQCLQDLRWLVEKFNSNDKYVGDIRGHGITELWQDYQAIPHDTDITFFDQPRPVECCSIVGISAHSNAYVLVESVLEDIWNAIAPGSVPSDSYEVEPKEFSELSIEQISAAELKKVSEAFDSLTIDQIDWLSITCAGEYSQIANAAIKTNSVFVPTPLQKSILEALNRKALKKQPLAVIVCGGEGTRLYRKGGIKELIDIGKVVHKNGVGYYRPDAPPPNSVVN
jgi:hypothetical protein